MPTTEAKIAPFHRAVARWIQLPAVSGLIGPALLFVICALFCWKLVLTEGYTWIDDPDVVHMDVPRMQFQTTAWHHREFPLWDPHLWCGQPFLGELTGAAYPLNWPFFMLRRNAEGHITFGMLNKYFFLLHFLGALFAYWLCRELGLSRIAAILGGFAFAFTGFFGLSRWPEVFTGVLLGPLVLLFAVRAMQRKRPISSAALSGMFLGIAWLSGHHEIPIYISLTLAGLWIYDLVSNRADWRMSLLLAAITFLFVALTSAFQTIPGYEYARLAIRWVGADHPLTWSEPVPYRVHADQSFTPSSLMAIVLPWAGRANAFTGVILLALAAVAVFTMWHSRWVRLFTCIAAAGLLLALGSSDILHGLLYALIPIFEKARNPNRLVYLFDFGVAVLAAFGLDSLALAVGSATLRGVRSALAGLAVLIFGIALATAAVQKPGPTDAAYMTALLAALFAAALYSRMSPPALSIITLLLVFIELGTVSAAVYWEVSPHGRQTWLPELSQYRDIATFLRAQPGPVRVDAVKVTGPFNLGDWEGIDTLNGYGAGVTANIFSLDWTTPTAQNLLAVNYSLSKDPPRADQQLVFHGSGGINVYKNVNAFPRAWIVHRVEPAGSAAQVLQRMRDPAFDGRTAAVMTGSPPALETCSGDEPARILWRSDNTVVIDARLACRGMLILADTWYPGWKAEVDGRAVPIAQPFNALRGVVVNGGAHRVVFKYRPASALVGAFLSFVGVLGACVLAFRDRRRA